MGGDFNEDAGSNMDWVFQIVVRAGGGQIPLPSRGGIGNFAGGHF